MHRLLMHPCRDTVHSLNSNYYTEMLILEPVAATLDILAVRCQRCHFDLRLHLAIDKSLARDGHSCATAANVAMFAVG